MLVKQVLINPPILKKWILQLPWHDEVSANSLIDPTNHQNVPKAIKAIIPTKNPHHSEMDPDAAGEHRALRIIGKLWSYFYQPFIDPLLNLTEQLTQLSAYSHLALVLYRQHGPLLMNPQLYYNSQSLVKAVYFYTSHQKALDPSKRVFLYQLGSDCQEQEFCDVRTATHDTNPDALGLSDSLSASADTSQFKLTYPELYHQHQRTAWTNSPNTDHVNPKFYKGDLTARNTNLSYAWSQG
ncbi:hypothetical protein BT96DRAFT_816805, partial [Gymnopus androsaceus JB14]